MANLRDNEEFMLEVFRKNKKAIEFDNVSDRLKEDAIFVQRAKDIFSSDSTEFFSLCISLRNFRKKKEENARNIKAGETDEFGELNKEKPIKVKKARTVTKRKDEGELLKNQNSEIDDFISLLEKLPIGNDDRDYLIMKYGDASAEKRLVVTLMIYDYISQHDKKALRVSRGNKNFFYRYF